MKTSTLTSLLVPLCEAYRDLKVSIKPSDMESLSRPLFMDGFISDAELILRMVQKCDPSQFPSPDPTLIAWKFLEMSDQGRIALDDTLQSMKSTILCKIVTAAAHYGAFAIWSGFRCNEDWVRTVFNGAYHMSYPEDPADDDPRFLNLVF